MAASMKCNECRKVRRCHLYKVRTAPEGEAPKPIRRCGPAQGGGMRPVLVLLVLLLMGCAAETSVRCPAPLATKGGCYAEARP